MKKLTLSIPAILFLSLSGFATHIYGGYMYATLISGRTVQYSATVYSDPASAASPFLSEINIKFGDGASAKLQRSEVQENGTIQANIYSVTHIYPSDGVFLASIDEPGLVSDIRNINSGIKTDQVNFNVQFMVRISSSVSLIKGFIGKPLAWLVPEAVESQNLQYNAVVSTQDLSLESRFSIKQYYDSSVTINTQGFGLNQYSGMLTFTPQIIGVYVIPVEVEMRNAGEVVAKMYYLQPIRVLVGTPINQKVYSANDGEWVNAGWYRKVVTTNTPVNYTFSALKTVNSVGYTLSSFGVLPDTNATTVSRSTNDSLFSDLSWTPLINQQRDLPYFITYRMASIQNPSRVMDVQLAFYHGAPLTASVQESTIENASLKVYPNPCSKNELATIPIAGDTKITVRDVTGKILLTTGTTENFQLDLTQFNTNLLFIQCEAQNGKISHSKLVIY